MLFLSGCKQGRKEAESAEKVFFAIFFSTLRKLIPLLIFLTNRNKGTKSLSHAFYFVYLSFSYKHFTILKREFHLR